MSYEQQSSQQNEGGGQQGELSTAIKALYQGYMPSNVTLMHALDSANRSIEDRIGEGRFSYEGEEMVRDLQALLADFHLVLHEKNRGEKLQRIFYQAKLLLKEPNVRESLQGRRRTQGPRGQSKEAQRVREELRDTVNAIRELAFTTIRSSEFRDVLFDMIELARDVLLQNAESVNMRDVAQRTGKAAKKASEQAKEETTKSKPQKGKVRIYQSQEPYTFIGQRIEEQEEKEGERKPSGVSSRTQKGETSGTRREGDDWDYSYGGKYNVNEDDYEYFRRKEQVSGQKSTGMTGVASNIMRRTFRDATGPLKEMTSGMRQKNLRENAKALRDTAQRAYRNMGEKGPQVSLSQEQKEEFTDRLHRILRTVAHNPSFKRGMRALMLLITDLRVQSAGKAQQARGKGATLTKEPHLQEMMKDLRAFLEEFTGPGSMQQLRDLFVELTDRIRRDPESTRFLQSLGRYIEVTLEHPELLEEQRHVERGSQFLEKSRELMYRYGYEDTTQRFLRELRKYFNRFFNDPIARKSVKDLQRFIDDLTMDRNGKFRFKTELLMELRDLIIPLVIDQLDYIPVPAIEGHSPKMDYWVDNIVFSGRDIIPDQISIETDNSIDIRPRERWEPFTEFRRERQQNLFTLRAQNIHAHAHGIQFWFHRKKAPKREDGGLVDVDIGGEGMEIEAVVGVQNPLTPPLFEVDDVRCKINDLSIHVTKSKTDWLYNIGYKIFSGNVRAAIQRQVETKLREMLYDVDLWLTDAIQRLSPQTPIIRMPRRLPPKRMLRESKSYGEYTQERPVPSYRRPVPPSVYRAQQDQQEAMKTREEPAPREEERRPKEAERGGWAIRPDVPDEKAERKRENRYQQYWDRFESEYGRRPQSEREPASRRRYGKEEEGRKRLSARDMLERMQKEQEMREEERREKQYSDLQKDRERYQQGQERPTFHDKRDELRRFPESSHTRTA